MLRRVVYTGARHHGGKLAPLLLILGIVMLFVFPMQLARRIFIDENAIGHMNPHVRSFSVTDRLDPVVHWPQRLVRGRRSPGSEIVALYVNTEYPASVSLANAVIEEIRHKSLSCDVQFYFVNSSEEWPVPQTYTRAALVLNVSSYIRDICVDTIGRNGMQPNQDYANTVMKHAYAHGLSASYLCQRPHPQEIPAEQGFWYYWAYLEHSLLVSRYPQPWHKIPTHSISTIAISTNSVHGGDSNSPSSRIPESLAKTVVNVIVSLSGLEEKFHHSTFVWLPVSWMTYVEYDQAQFCILLFVISIFSTAYSEYQLRGVTITPKFVTLLLAPAVAGAALQVGGWGAVVAVSGALSVLLRLLMAHVTSGMLLTYNAIAMSLMIILHPACGLVAGAVAATQVLFTHAALQNRGTMAVGVGVSSVSIYYFFYRLGMPLCGVAGVSELFVSFVIYPNAVWVGSRFLCLI